MSDYMNLLESVAKSVTDRYNFDLIDNLLGPPSKEAIMGAIEDALDEINAIGVQTYFDLKYVVTSKDTRWRRYLYLGAAKNVMLQQAVRFANDSYTIDIGELTVEDRLSEIKDMAESMHDDFYSKIETLKEASQKFVKGVRGSGRREYEVSFSRAYVTGRGTFGRRTHMSRGR